MNLFFSDLPKSDDQPTLHSLIISRNEWSAREPQRPLFPLELPAVNVIIAHTAGQNIVSNQVILNCTLMMKKTV